MTEGKITVTIQAPGYTSGIDLPIGVDIDIAEAFCGWFEMQLAYLARWQPGSTATIRKATPI